MSDFSTTYENELLQEIRSTPEEYLPSLLSLVRLFRRTILLKPAEASFYQGWQEVLAGETFPIEELWMDMDGQ